MKKTLKQMRADVCKLSDGLLTAQSTAEQIYKDIEQLMSNDPNCGRLMENYAEMLETIREDLQIMSLQVIDIYSQLGYFNLSIPVNTLSESGKKSPFSTELCTAR